MAKHKIRTIILPNGELVSIIGTALVFQGKLDLENQLDNSSRHLIAYLTEEDPTDSTIKIINLTNTIEDILQDKSRIVIKIDTNISNILADNNKGTDLKFLLSQNLEQAIYSNIVPIYRNKTNRFTDTIPAGSVFVLTYYQQYTNNSPAWIIDMGSSSVGGGGEGGGSSLLYIKDGNNESVLQGNVNNNIANGLYSDANGDHTISVGKSSSASGSRTFAKLPNSLAKGLFSNAKGQSSSARGINAVASGLAASAEGLNTIADGIASHAGGQGTIATEPNQTVIGQYNELIEDSSSGDYAFVIGNGTKDVITEEQNGLEVEIGEEINRHNALTVDWDGNVDISGEYKINGVSINVSAGNLPNVTTADNGKFLQVVNGVWAANTISSASGVSF